jgi:HEAT repeat protein
VLELIRLNVVPSRQAKVAGVLAELAAADAKAGRHGALMALAKWADPSCAPALAELAKSRDPYTAAKAAEILANVRNPSGAEQRTAASAKPAGNKPAADGSKPAGSGGSAPSVAELIGKLKARAHDREQALALADSLGRAARNSVACQAVVDLLRDEDIVVRALAVEALRRIDTEESRAAIDKFLKTEPPSFALLTALEAARN